MVVWRMVLDMDKGVPVAKTLNPRNRNKWELSNDAAFKYARKCA